MIRDGLQRKAGQWTVHKFDALGRLVKAEDTDRLREEFEYDLNTNIVRLERSYGGVDVQKATITYNGNQRDSIAENTPQILVGVVPAISGSKPEYDANGRICADVNRGIASVKYDAYTPTLPLRITLADGQSYVAFARNSDGTCRSRTETTRRLMATGRLDANGDSIRQWKTVSTDYYKYFGNYEQTPDGRWRYHTARGYYSYGDSAHHYYAQDYMGNTRAVYHNRIGDKVVIVIPRATAPAVLPDRFKYFVTQ